MSCSPEAATSGARGCSFRLRCCISFSPAVQAVTARALLRGRASWAQCSCCNDYEKRFAAQPLIDGDYISFLYNLLLSLELLTNGLAFWFFLIVCVFTTNSFPHGSCVNSSHFAEIPFPVPFLFLGAPLDLPCFIPKRFFSTCAALLFWKLFSPLSVLEALFSGCPVILDLFLSFKDTPLQRLLEKGTMWRLWPCRRWAGRECETDALQNCEDVSSVVLASRAAPAEFGAVPFPALRCGTWF